MDEKRDLFPRYAGTIGSSRSKGYFDPSSIKDLPGRSWLCGIMEEALLEFKSEVDELNSEYRAKGKPGVNLHVGYVISDRRNAWAQTLDGQDYIAVTTGLVISLTAILSSAARKMAVLRCLCDQGFGLYSSPKPESLPLFCMDSAHGLSNSHINQIDEISLFILNDMLKTSINWLFHHELAHIWNGHTGLPISRSNKGVDEKVLLADADVEDLGIIQLDRLTLEMDADSRASHVFLSKMLGWDYAVGASALKEFKGLADFRPVGSMFLWRTSAILCLISLFQLDASYSVGVNTTHPSFSVRRHWVVSKFRNSLSEFDRILEGEISRVTDFAQILSSSIMSETFGIPLDRLFEFLESEDTGETKITVYAWAVMYPHLEGYKRGCQNVPPHPKAEEFWKSFDPTKI